MALRPPDVRSTVEALTTGWFPSLRTAEADWMSPILSMTSEQAATLSADRWFELLLFSGFVGLHIKIIPFLPRLTPRASGALRLTSLVESGAPRLKSFLKTGMVTTFHTVSC